jgi:hypothetical protein
MRFLFLLPLICTACATSFNSNGVLARLPANLVSIDEKFIENALGKSFVYVRPKQADGEPNCVAAAFRAGGYLPAFALNGTDSMYEHILPICFRRKVTTEAPARGDIGVIYADSVPTLAHMVLFLDQDRVFEKPGPQNEQVFRYNSWNRILESGLTGVSFQVWSYQPTQKCPLQDIANDFTDNPDSENLRLVAREIDHKIYSGKWNAPSTFNRKRLSEMVKENERNLLPLFRGKKFDINLSFPAYYKVTFKSDVYKTLLRSPRDN